MKRHIDKEADALYFRLDDSAIEMHLHSFRAGAHPALPVETLHQSQSLHPRIRHGLTA